MTAEAWITGEAPNQKIHFKLPSGTKGEASTVPGPKGAPGGFVDGTILGTTNLNTVVISGIYQQYELAKGTKANGYPVDGMVGVLTVHRTADGRVHQTLKRAGGYSGGQVVYLRGGTTLSVTASWTAAPTSRVDNTAGRAIYQWDDTANREQLIYGDTGRRNVAPLLSSGWVLGAGGSASIRRSGSTVDLRLEMIDGTDASGNTPFVFPPGFSPNETSLHRVRGLAYAGAGSSITVRRFYTQNNEITIDGFMGTAGVSVCTTFTTTDPWPTSLPGAAYGTIPNL